MKTLASVLLMFFFAFTQAQPLTGSFTDCNNTTKDIQTVLGSGKALIVAHKGVDCSICISQSSGLQSWASANKTKVEVWGAMTWKYRSSAFNPPCAVTQQWVSTHSWTDIFTFPDYNRQFLNIGTPQYYVYSPRDSTIKYSGPSSSQAYSVALQESTVGIQDQLFRSELKYSIVDRQLLIDNRRTQSLDLLIYDLKGQLISERRLENSRSEIDLSHLKSSVYLINFRSSTSSFTEKILLQ